MVIIYTVCINSDCAQVSTLPFKPITDYLLHTLFQPCNEAGAAGGVEFNLHGDIVYRSALNGVTLHPH